MKESGGTFVISLDFELMWGMFDVVSKTDYQKNLDGVWTVVPETLELFSKYNVSATWAVVGMLMHKNKSNLLESLPKEINQPQYLRPELSAYNHLKENTLIEEKDSSYFASDLVDKICNSKNQELASHTYSHYYCLEEQSNSDHLSDRFVIDCNKFSEVSSKFDQPIKSMVFPRNQWSREALGTLAKLGFTCYRGTEKHFFYQARSQTKQRNPLIRLMRALDNYLNLSGYHTYDHKNLLPDNASPLINIPSSRFLRPYSNKLFFLEPVRRRRIKKAMTHAAKHNQVFHLWWHPHNFGVNQKENLQTLANILDHYQKLQKKYGMKSQNMGQLAKSIAEFSA